VLKETPTMIEAGFPDFVIRDWLGLIVRAGTPHAIIEQLNAALNRGMADPEVRAQLDRMGADVATGTPREFDALIAAEVGRWGKLVKTSGMKPD
jgi:tripartite-type tricarboxylate transporter receptor subunit TctC